MSFIHRACARISGVHAQCVDPDFECVTSPSKLAFAVIVGGAFCLAVVLFVQLMDVVEKFRIRRYLARRGLGLARIQTYKTHYAVKYIEAGVKKSGRWPDDFT